VGSAGDGGMQGSAGRSQTEDEWWISDYMADILIVDDNPTMVEMLSTALSIFGHNPMQALSGEQALDLLGHARPDLVFLDLTMPGMDGYETLRRVRALEDGENIPVVVLTAAAELDLEERIRLAGGTACLRKPVEMDTLSQTVRKYARRTERERAA
jgi:CheY-like chemotaxis protein